MKIIIEDCPNSLATVLRKIGYSFKRLDQGAKEISAVRALARGGFPRFHIYAKMEGNKLYLNLHIDQKRPSYKGWRAHSGEHKGETIEKEVQRIKTMLFSVL